METHMSLIGKEIFVVVGDFDDFDDIAFFSEIEEVFNHLKGVSPEDNFDIKVLHGALTKAEAIPEDTKDRGCFIIVVAPQTTQGVGLKGVVIESDYGNTTDVLAEEIEELINNQTIPIMDRVDIDDVYILYGYRIELGLCIDEENIDEENIGKCKEVAKNSEEIRKLVHKTEGAA